MLGLGLGLNARRSQVAGGGGGASSFEYDFGGETNSATAIYAGETDFFQYTNDSGGPVTVNFIDLLECATVNAGAGLRMAIYDDTGSNLPGALLEEANGITGIVAGDNTLSLTTGVLVAAGQKIWVAAKATVSITCNRAARANDGLYRFRSGEGHGTVFVNPVNASNSFSGSIPARFRTS